MAWGQWMVVNLTIEEELEVERLARSAINHPEPEQVAAIAASLVKQNAYQKKILQQAVRYISELEIKNALAQDVAEAPWHSRLSGHPILHFFRKLKP
jgi:hypothetical protein